MTHHNRRNIRLYGYDYSQEGLYFVTICVQNRVCSFGDIGTGEMIVNDAGKIINNEWQHLKIKYPHVELHEYVIMPNHFHGIVEITDFKYQTAKKINSPFRLWQRNYYEHIVRNEEDYCNISEYIVNKPYSWSIDNYYINCGL